MDRDLVEGKQADYRCCTVQGSHYDIGYATAKQGGFLPAPGGRLSREQRQYAERCRSLVHDIFPEMIEESIGYAEALQLPEEELLVHYTRDVDSGGSALAVATDEGIVVGRNFDCAAPDIRRRLVFTSPASGFAHIGMHAATAGGRFDGMNEKGLYASFNGSGFPAAAPVPSAPGLSAQMAVRFLLEKCATVREAEAALQSLPVKDAKTYLVADPFAAFAAEIHPQRRNIRRMHDGVIAAAGHFVHPEMSGLQKKTANSVAKYTRLLGNGRKIRACADNWFAQMQETLSEHAAPVCEHVGSFSTCWSCIGNTRGAELHYSPGAPCRNPYHPYFRFKQVRSVTV